MLFLHLNGVAVGNIFSKGQISAAFNPHPINVTQMNHYGGTGFGVLPDIPGNSLLNITYIICLHCLFTFFVYISCRWSQLSPRNH